MGLVWPFGRPAGLHLAHLRLSATGTHRLRAHQCGRRLGASVGRRCGQHHAGLPAQRSAVAQGEGLARALLEPVGGIDLVPMGDKVLVASPGFTNPMADATELEITGRTTGRIALAGGFGSHGEKVACTRAKSGKITELWLAGSKLLPAAKVAREMEARYGKKRKRKRQRTPR